ncbi:MAG: tetratricopeptide repeat protein [Candidatus Kapaibacterium sp.]
MAENTENQGFEPAEISEGEEVQSFISKYKTLIIIASVAIVAIVGVIYYMNSVQNANEKEAAEKLASILPAYEQMDYTKALYGDSALPELKRYGLIRIAKEFDGTAPGRTAALYAGNSLLATGNFEEARKYFEIAQSADSRVVSFGATAGIGSCLENDGKYAEAARKYDEAASMAEAPAVRNRYQYYAGLCYEQTGDNNKAEEIYRKIIAEEKFSEIAGYAKSGLARLGMKIE